MEKIPVSVIIPVKNEEKNLPRCLSLLKDFLKLSWWIRTVRIKHHK